MPYQVLIPLFAGIVFTACYVREKLRAYSLKALCVKLCASVCFVACALCGMVFSARPGAGYGALVTGGLVWGLLGDLVLDLKYIDREREHFHTVSGFVFFGVGHVCFMLAAFLTVGRRLPLPALWVLASLAAGFAAGYLTTKSASRWGNDYGEDFTIVALYSGTLASAAVLAILYTVLPRLLPDAGAAGALWPMSAGLVSFMLSDLILSRSYYGKDHHKPADIISNYVFYYAAQFLIALSVSIA